MVAHLDHLGSGDDVEPVGRAPFRSEHGVNFLLVAEQHDTAVRSDLSERQNSALHSRFGSVIAAHGVYTNLYHTRAIWLLSPPATRTYGNGRATPGPIRVKRKRLLHKKRGKPCGMHSSECRTYSAAFFSIASFPR